MWRLVVTALLLALAGCSLLLDTAEPTQCSTDGDCVANPAFQNRVCHAGFCVVPAESRVPVSNNADEKCVTTERCTQANSGQASFCKTPGTPCVVWENEQCRFIEGAWSDPNAIVIGDIQPFTAKQQDGSRWPILYADRVRKSIDLALSEFAAEQPGGLTFPDGRRRPFAVLHCDSGFDEEEARTAMRHLTDVVGVQAVIVGGDDDLAAITPLATEKQTAIACSDCIAPLPEGPFAWRIVPRITLEAPMAAWRVADLETSIKAHDPAPIKVAVLVTPGRSGDSFVAALLDKETLRFNDKSAVDVDNITRFLIERAEDPGEASVNHGRHAEKIRLFEPDIVVVAMAADFPNYYLDLIEKGWTSPKHRPYYITTNLNRNVTTFLDVLDTNDDLRKRISGTRPGYAEELESNLGGFTSRYLQAYSFNHPDNAESGYDAFYAMAFAILGTRMQSLLDGPHISAGFERLVGGSTVLDFKPTSIATATLLLGQATQKLDVRGTISDLDWELPGRDMVQDVSMYCYERNGSSLVINPNAGPRLASKTGMVTGTYGCQ